MKFFADYHIHSKFGLTMHAKSTVLENAVCAKQKGLSEIAISNHGPAHVLYGLRKKNFNSIKKQIEFAKNKTGINILFGVEANIISKNGEIDIPKNMQNEFDIILCGVHRAIAQKCGKNYAYSGFRKFLAKIFLHGTAKQKYLSNQKNRTTQMVISAIENNKIDILTHPGRYQEIDYIAVAKCCQKNNVMFEINTKKCEFNLEQLKEIAKTGVVFVLGSDAHCKNRVGDFEKYEKLLDGVIDKTQIFNANKNSFKKLRK